MPEILQELRRLCDHILEFVKVYASDSMSYSHGHCLDDHDYEREYVAVHVVMTCDIYVENLSRSFRFHDFSLKLDLV